MMELAGPYFGWKKINQIVGVGIKSLHLIGIGLLIAVHQMILVNVVIRFIEVVEY